MKKTLIILSTLLLTSFQAFADDKADVLATFDKYVNDANNYSTNLPNHYISNAKILRTVNKKQGGQKTIQIPFDRYLKELQAHSTLAKTLKYKNNYTDRKISKQDNDYKITANRVPRNDKTGLPCYFVYTKQNNIWKIKEENLSTNVQTFLNAK